MSHPYPVGSTVRRVDTIVGCDSIGIVTMAYDTGYDINITDGKDGLETGNHCHWAKEYTRLVYSGKPTWEV